MNSVNLTGRLTRDPEFKYSQSTGNAVAHFSLAVERPLKQNGEKQVDFPRIAVFGKQAENVEKYVVKGMLVGIEGRIQTGSYQNKDGVTVYTTEVVAERVEFLEWRDKNGGGQQMQQPNMGYQQPMGYGYQQPMGGVYSQGQMQGMYPQQNYGQQPMQAPAQMTVQQTLLGQNQQQAVTQPQMQVNGQQMMQNQQAPAQSMPQQNVQQAPVQDEIPDNFAAIDEDVPF